MMDEKEFEEFIKPIERTPPLHEQKEFILAYEVAYKRLKRLFQRTSQEKELDEIYQSTAENINLL